MTFEFTRGFANDVYGRTTDHRAPARAINDHAGIIVVTSHGNGLGSYLTIVDEEAWQQHIAPHVKTAADRSFQLTLPEATV